LTGRKSERRGTDVLSLKESFAEGTRAGIAAGAGRGFFHAMKILEILDKRFIIPNLAARGKEGVLRELVRVIAQVEKQVDEERMLEILLERETLGSTGIGEGVAIPHGKSKTVKKLLASFGRSVPGLDFQAMDGKPTHLFFLLVAPEDSAGIHLKALARISRLMKDASFRKRLLEAETGDEIYSIFAEGDEKF
jgi:nitrogen PTS system EIIA component